MNVYSQLKSLGSNLSSKVGTLVPSPFSFKSNLEASEPALDLASFSSLFDSYYLQKFDELIERAAKITDYSENQKLVKHARALSYGGKRIRPYLCYLSYVSSGGSSFEDIKDICVALELIHLFALVHDDIMDESTTRRGVTTTHHAYGEMTETSTSRRSAESMAILLGDLIYTWALEIASEYFATHRNEKARQTVFTLLREVIHGQMIDIVISDASSVTIEELQEKNHLKTSSYTFIRPMHIGCLLADTQNCDAFISAGKHLGEAFQVIDDVIDIAGNSKTTNKDTCLDVEMAQHTLISNYIKDNASEDIKEKFFSYFGNKLNAEDRSLVQKLALDSGAIEASRSHASEEIDRGLAMLKNTINPETYMQWHNLGEMLKSRMN